MPLPSHKPLTEEEQKRFFLLLQEAQNRGIALPKEVKKSLQDKKKAQWPIDESGYFLRDDGKNYNPSENHKGFIESSARYVLLYGPRGCGKSGAGAQKAMLKIMQGEDGIIANPDFENLKISTWPEFKRWIPWDMVIPSQRHRQSNAWQPSQPFMMAFINGVKVYIKGGKDSSSSRGPNVNWFWYDEGGRDETGLSWQITNAGVRIGKSPQAWCTETPRPMEHWSYKFFIDKDIPEEAIQEFHKATKGDRILVEWFHATREDNKENLDATFYASLSVNYPSGWLRTQEFEGNFANEGGKIGDRAWFNNRILITPPTEGIISKLRFWDLAGTEKKLVDKKMNDPDETVGSLVSKFMPTDEFIQEYKANAKVPNFCVEHQVCGYWAEAKLMDVILNTARYDGPFVPVYIEEEPASSGKNFIEVVKQKFKEFPELRSHKVEGLRARDLGDRVQAANTYWFGQAATGNMWMVKGEWNNKTLNQLDSFTQIPHDDRITSITGAMYKLNPWKTWKKIPFISL